LRGLGDVVSRCVEGSTSTEGKFMSDDPDIATSISDDHVATVEIQRPPNNFFDKALIAELASTFERLDDDSQCRAIVLCSKGKHFCAGANFGGDKTSRIVDDDGRHLYDEAARLFATRTPVVAAIHGAAIGGGLGLALMPDFRVAAPEARFSANFARLGFHHGFALSVTLPRLVGPQGAAELLYTGRRVSGEEALTLGLCDKLVPLAELRTEAHAFAAEIALSAPLAIDSIRETLRRDLVEAIVAATDREKSEQERLQKTSDFKEGVKAMGERRKPNFLGR
jgi:2-(1,2-epoxy-1,2-dihydrophenyl)acetyl-CoA isomerase